MLSMEPENMITIVVDQKEIQAPAGTSLLKACLDNGIYIPNLCYMEDRETPFGGCRLCFVQIDGSSAPVASCTVKIEGPMTVCTDTDEVRRLQRSALQLMLSVHHVDCKNCRANKNCGLQDIARFLKVGLKPKHLEQHLKPVEIDTSHPCLDYYPNRCVLCGKCVHVCNNRSGGCSVTFARRGFDTVVSTHGATEGISCAECAACADICPVGALVLKESVVA